MPNLTISFIRGGLQMLSPPPYGSIGAPIQNQQQYTLVNTPLQQPVYPQARDNSGASNMRRPVPNMFRNALVRVRRSTVQSEFTCMSNYNPRRSRIALEYLSRHRRLSVPLHPTPCSTHLRELSERQMQGNSRSIRSALSHALASVSSLT